MARLLMALLLVGCSSGTSISDCSRVCRQGAVKEYSNTETGTLCECQSRAKKLRSSAKHNN